MTQPTMLEKLPFRLANAIRRVEAVAIGGTIIGVYRASPLAAVDAFRSDLNLLIDSILSQEKGVDNGQ